MLFQKILNDLAQKIHTQDAYTETIITTFQEVVGVRITKDMVGSIQEGVLILKLPPTLKMALQYKKVALVQALQARHIAVVDVR